MWAAATYASARDRRILSVCPRLDLCSGTHTLEIEQCSGRGATDVHAARPCRGEQSSEEGLQGVERQDSSETLGIQCPFSSWANEAQGLQGFSIAFRVRAAAWWKLGFGESAETAASASARRKRGRFFADRREGSYQKKILRKCKNLAN